jgi:5'-3' exonuclease
MSSIVVHLVDGTYELFRHYHALPSAVDAEGREVGAVRGVLSSILAMIPAGATHVAVATDHVIESFRNGLWPTYKTSAGVPEDLLSQFGPLEDVLSAAGFVVWPMTELEADDALAAAAAKGATDSRVEKVVICTPDKDLAQCVRGTRVVQLNRRTREVRDEAGVISKFGVRRHRRRVPRPPRLGREVGGLDPRPLGPPGGHPDGLPDVGRRDPGRVEAERHAP